MKITEMIERDCCMLEDMVPYHGALKLGGGIMFCRHCGEIWKVDHYPGGTKLTKVFDGKTPYEAFLEVVEHGGAWISSAQCTVKEIDRARAEGRWFEIDSLGFVRLPREWFQPKVESA